MGKTKINVPKEHFDGWLVDLRSGNFEQGQDRLKAEDVRGAIRHCCLGVLGDRLDLLVKDHFENWKCPTSSQGDEALYLPWDVIDMDTQKTVAKMNDDCVSFDDIADYIEQNLEPTDG
jgi:hypothetical protein